MGRFMFCTQEGYVLYVCTKFEAHGSIHSKVIRVRGSQNFEIGSRDPGHAHLHMVHTQEGFVLSSMSVPNL